MSAIATCGDCGWTSKPCRSENQADHAGRLHRCSRYQTVQDRAARVVARKAADGPYRGCRHKIARHHHGTHACFVLDKCRCRPCRNANTAYENQRAKDRAAGIEAYVDAEPVRAHIAMLRAHGLGPKLLAQHSGVPHGAISKIVYGDYGRHRPPSRRCRPETAAKILAVQPTIHTLGARVAVDAGPTLRRLQALVCEGWSISHLARVMGNSNLHKIFDQDIVGAGTARRTVDVYEQLIDQVPPAQTHREKISVTRARNYARAHGWLPADHWEDIDAAIPFELDDDIDPVVVERLVAGEQVTEPNDAELGEATRILLGRGWTPSAAARHLHVSSYRLATLAS